LGVGPHSNFIKVYKSLVICEHFPNQNKSSAVVEMGDRLATVDMGQKVGAAVPLLEEAGSPSNTMSPEPRPTTTPSGILIHQTVWPQYTNVTDRQDNGSVALGKPRGFDAT